jgi:hypothetical protein
MAYLKITTVDIQGELDEFDNPVTNIIKWE